MKDIQQTWITKKDDAAGVYIKTTTTTETQELEDHRIVGGCELVINGRLYLIDNVRRSFGELTISATAVGYDKDGS